MGPQYWKTKCFVCLGTKNEKLRSTTEGWPLFGKNIPKIYKYGKLSFPLSRLNGNGVDDTEPSHGVLFNFLKGKAAKYHKSCLDKYSDLWYSQPKMRMQREAMEVKKKLLQTLILTYRVHRANDEVRHLPANRNYCFVVSVGKKISTKI